MPLKVIVTVELAAKPVPVTLTVFPTGPLSGDREMLAVDDGGGVGDVTVPVNVLLDGVCVVMVGSPVTVPVSCDGVNGVTVCDVVDVVVLVPVNCDESAGVTVDDAADVVVLVPVNGGGLDGVTVDEVGVTVPPDEATVDDVVRIPPVGATVDAVGVTVPPDEPTIDDVVMIPPVGCTVDEVGVTVVSDGVAVDDVEVIVDDVGVMLDDGTFDEGDTVEEVGLTSVDVGVTKVDDVAANVAPNVIVDIKSMKRRHRVFSSVLKADGYIA